MLGNGGYEWEEMKGCVGKWPGKKWTGEGKEIGEGRNWGKEDGKGSKWENG